MTKDQRERFFKHFRETYCDAVMTSKGPEYSKGSGGKELDVNANFKLVADLLDGAPVDALTAAMVYALKHVASLCRYVVTREEGSENIYNRLGDLSNYMGIMASLIAEAEAEPPQRQQEYRMASAAQTLKEFEDKVEVGMNVVAQELTEKRAEIFKNGDRKWQTKRN